MTYKSATVDVIEALTNSGKTFECLFEGENAAGTQRRIQARYFRCRLNPSSQQDWLNTELPRCRGHCQGSDGPDQGRRWKVEVLQHQEGTGDGVTPFMPGRDARRAISDSDLSLSLPEPGYVLGFDAGAVMLKSSSSYREDGYEMPKLRI